jgi:hypothetical protein
MAVFILCERIAVLPPPPIMEVAVLTVTIGVLVFAIALIWSSTNFIRVDRNERRAGYTTLSGRGYRRYWKLDPATGSVLARPTGGTKPNE